ncbi:MAG: pyridoxamine 5'-phosphate oxidase [Alphaproteobacteria bacterium]|nr:pyridoxamine 5'-phosphate oxidase [Alphaproteobacteria bacterium]
MASADLIPILDDPMALFEAWFQEAQDSELNDPDAMSLATATPDGKPSLRMVLLKGLSPGGFAFYTNKESNKGEQIAANAQAALCFHWKSLRRQVRVEGILTEIDENQADAYFASRSRESQIAAWASDQSRSMTDRAEFMDRFAVATRRFDGQDVPRPTHWSGFLLTPAMIEFWLDQPHRMHDRLVYRREGKSWLTERLYP